MKRIGNLYNCICSIENLQLAHKKASSRKGYQDGIKRFNINTDANLNVIQSMLIDKTYRVSSYNTFSIYEPKERIIYSLPYIDRVVQHAIMNLLEPVFVSCFTADTYSCIKGRGIHAASFALRRALRDENATTYCLKLDVQKFYPSINHAILKQLLRRKIKDADLLWLLDLIIDSADGVPIGNYLSQYFANYYLTGFDHWLKETLRVGPYFRYCDDMVFLSDNKAYLHSLLVEIKQYLGDNLKLTIKPNHSVFPVTDKIAIDVFGYKHFRHYTHIRPTIKRRFARMLAKPHNPSQIAAYYGWLKHANCKHLLKTLLTPT